MIRAVALAMLLATPAFGDVKSNGRVIECFCTDKTGARVELGQVICMQVDGRMFMARCEMSLNNPMWREVNEGCMTSELPPYSPVPDNFFQNG